MNTAYLKKLYFKDTSFANLMTHRIYNVLLYASKYDVFVLEEDGRIDEQIFNEYISLNLRYPPRFTLVSTEAEANTLLKERQFELIISMPGSDTVNPFEWAKGVKNRYPDIPIVLLTPFSKSVTLRLAKEDLSAIDYVFSWLGNSDLLLAIIKLIEDKMNVEADVASVGVQVILVVEDSIRWYSSIVPHLFKYVFKQSRSFMTEALNEHEQMLRMRGRPKIMLARSYEEALLVYNKFKNNLLGVITDVSYIQHGIKNKQAGINLCREIRKEDKFIPLIIQSTDESNRPLSEEVNAVFIHKMSKTFLFELRESITNNFSFGDFVFTNPETGKEEMRIRNLRDLQDNIFNLNDNTLFYHVSKNNISRWLYSRAMFPLAEFLRNVHVPANTPENMVKVKQIIFDAIVHYRKIKNKGVVALFQRDRFDQYSNFARIGDGSLGGKGRGLAFIDAMIKRNESLEQFSNCQIVIPKTVVLCTENFTEFMEMNDLYPIALSDIEDEDILKYFLKARVPQRLIADLVVFLGVVRSPIAVRSSSLLEDSQYQPFAGIYSTYMVPFIPNSSTHMLEMILEAIKAVYASVFYRSSKAYMTSTKNMIDEEKMAIVLQEMCGNAYENRFYPSLSGVARSLNYYPIGAEQPDEGIANIAMGLGKHIVDGGISLRFSPSHPNSVLQTSTIKLALRETQTTFNALDLSQTNFIPQVDDGFNLLKISIADAEKDGTLRYVASTYNPKDDTLNDNVYPGGRKIITFANILKHNVLPLSDILKEVLNIAQSEMGRPIEIEFAANLDYSPAKQHTFYLLQIRPIVDSREVLNEDLNKISKDQTIIICRNALGHGLTSDIHDIVYVKPDTFDASKSIDIMKNIDDINQQLTKENKHYALIGPGRWGSSDPWLGIPVKWQHISNARLIVEAGLSHYRIEPSQGTHFFQNLTSFGIGYFTINPFQEDGFYDVDFLNSIPAVFENEFVRHVHFNHSFIVKIDGKSKLGLLLKPER